MTTWARKLARVKTEAERLVRKRDEHVGDDWSYEIEIEWKGTGLHVVWTYESVRCLGIDSDQVLTLEIDGTSAVVDHRGIEVKPIGPHHETLLAVLERGFYDN